MGNVTALCLKCMAYIVHPFHDNGKINEACPPEFYEDGRAPQLGDANEK